MARAMPFRHLGLWKVNLELVVEFMLHFLCNKLWIAILMIKTEIGGVVVSLTRHLGPIRYHNFLFTSFVGGQMDIVFDYIKKNGGINKNSSYPYTGKRDTCKYNPLKSAGTNTGFVRIPRGNETALKEAVANVGPVSVGIDANWSSFLFYKSGIYTEPNCNPININHAGKFLEILIMTFNESQLLLTRQY